MKPSPIFEQAQLQDCRLKLSDEKNGSFFQLSIPEIKFRKGDKISIRAASGSGKTTFLLSLMNLVNYEGHIKIDEVELKEINLSPTFVSYVSPAEPLFPLSLEENITLGRKIDKANMDEVITGLGIDSFASKIDTVLGRANANLSLGQSQRIRLARAIVSKSPLLLLDEPLTGLDPLARESVKQFIVNYCKDSTIIVASHDLEDRLMASRHWVIHENVMLEER